MWIPSINPGPFILKRPHQLPDPHTQLELGDDCLAYGGGSDDDDGATSVYPNVKSLAMFYLPTNRIKML